MQKTIIITGASRGIGFELAKELIGHGNKVLAVARSKNGLDKLSRTVDANLLTIIPTDINDIEASGQLILEQVEMIDGIIHNAAQFINKPFDQMQLQDLQNIYHTNVFVPYLLTQYLLESLTKGAHILNISSVGGIGGSMKFAGLSAYSSSKAAMNILTECLAEELREREIYVNTAALGSVQTEMFSQAFPQMQASAQPTAMAKLIARLFLEAVPLANGKLFNLSSSNP
jgi:short-subunit dehydrogenase